jgi:D-alanyl-D-alanine carboxypeptidase (penicillin-binding protein 5/6)
MNDEARILALRSTHIADPSGLDPRTVSTPLDLIRLGEVALRIPGFIQIVSLGETTLPNVPLSYNLNFDLGHDGIVGIMSASSAAAQGCYLFAAEQVVDGRSVTVVGAVLGQTGASANSAAVEAGDGLDKAALASIGVFPVLSPGQIVGTLVTPWGAQSPLTAATSMSVLGWPGLTVSFAAYVELHAPVQRDAPVGLLRARQAGHPDAVFMRTSRAMSGPSTLWRLTRTS